MEKSRIELTHGGRRLEHLEGDEFGLPDEEIRFTRDQVVKAITSQATLLLQTDDGDTMTVTSEIEVLLKSIEIIEKTGNIEELLVPRK